MGYRYVLEVSHFFELVQAGTQICGFLPQNYQPKRHASVFFRGAGGFGGDGEGVGGEFGGGLEIGHLVFAHVAVEFHQLHVLEKVVGLAVAQLYAGIAADGLLAGCDDHVGGAGELLDIDVGVVVVSDLLRVAFHAVEKRLAHPSHRGVAADVETAFTAVLTDEDIVAGDYHEVCRRRVIVEGEAARGGIINLAGEFLGCLLACSRLREREIGFEFARRLG